MTRLVLSLFPGIGLLDRAFEEEGFCIVRGPDLLWGGDIRNFHPPAGVFWGVIGGPPCKEFSPMAAICRSKGILSRQPNAIPDFERVTGEAQPLWFIMENVPRAPLPHVSGYQVVDALLSPHWLGYEQSRVRRFSFGTRDGRRFPVEDDLLLIGVPYRPEYAVTCTSGFLALNGKGNPKSKVTIQRIKDARKRSLERNCELQGLPTDFLRHAPFTAAAKREVVGNGVPLPMGRAIAKAVKRAMGA